MLELSVLEKAVAIAKEAGIPQDALVRWLSPKLSASFADLDFLMNRRLLHRAELVIPSEGIDRANGGHRSKSNARNSVNLARFETLEVDDDNED